MNTPRDENILPQTIYTQKYPTVNFSQTTVIELSGNKCLSTKTLP